MYSLQSRKSQLYACTVVYTDPQHAGARDGALMVWDSREVAKWDADRGVTTNSPVMVMKDAHKYISSAAESARKRRKQV